MPLLLYLTSHDEQVVCLARRLAMEIINWFGSCCYHMKSGCMVRILFLLTQSLESPGGGGRFWPIAKALTKRGYQVTIAALHHNYVELEQRRFCHEGIEVWYVAQMHVRKVGNAKMYFSPWKLLWYTFWATVRLTWAVLRTPCDVVQVCKTQPMNGLAAWVAHIVKRVPVFLDSDDYEAVNNRFGGRYQQRIVAWFEDWMPSFATGIIANSRFILERFASLGFPRERMALVPNGVDEARFSILDRENVTQCLSNLRESLGLRPQQSTVVYVGSMSLVSHAVDLLLEAFAQVVQAEPEARLILVGSGEDLPLLQTLAESLRIEDKVLFLGRVPSENIPLYFRLGLVTTDPLRDTVPAQSSLSLKLMESIVAGVPCVTTDVGDRQEIVGEAGLAVKPGDAAALAQALLTVLQNQALRQKMHEEAKRLRPRCLWDSRIAELLNLYLTTLDKGMLSDQRG